MNNDGRLYQLPNKDLWRGHVKSPKPTEDTVRITAEEQNPLNKAMAAMLIAAKGAKELTCLWCGLQGDERGMRDHLEKNHPSVVKPAKESEIALTEMTRAQEALAAINKE